jgi:hypothetical protein
MGVAGNVGSDKSLEALMSSPHSSWVAAAIIVEASLSFVGIFQTGIISPV